MISDSNKKIWKNLFSLTKEIFDINPWSKYPELEMIKMTLANHKEPFYVVFIEGAILVYPGLAALENLFKLVEKEDMPSLQRLRYQYQLTAFFGSKDDVSEEGLNLITELGLNFMDDEWIFFESSMPNLLPMICSIQEVKILVDIFRQVKMVLNDDQATSNEQSIEEAVIHRYFDFEKGKWVTKHEKFVRLTHSIKPVQLDENHRKELIECPRNHNQWEIDIAYTPLMADQKEGFRQAIVRILVVANLDSGEIYQQKLLTLQHQSQQILVTSLLECIKQFGCPSSLRVRDEDAAIWIEEICDILKIDCTINSNLTAIDYFVDQLILMSENSF